MIITYWQIGQWIVEDEQSGASKAEYGEQTLSQLSQQLSEQFGKGFDVSNLRHMRRFYQAFPIRDALRPDFCFSPTDILKDPYVLEFLDLEEKEHFTESELETALIEKLQSFLLELGKGFSFVGRQRRITLDGTHFYIDLVFYNYLLKCFVLIDLKIGELTHQDIGQMDTYVRLSEDKWRGEDDNPTIGLILCTEKNEAIAKYSVLADGKQFFASKYQLILPTEEELAKELIALEAEIEGQIKITEG